MARLKIVDPFGTTSIPSTAIPTRPFRGVDAAGRHGHRHHQRPVGHPGDGQLPQPQHPQFA
jgi:hypothetical protein